MIPTAAAAWQKRGEKRVGRQSDSLLGMTRQGGADSGYPAIATEWIASRSRWALHWPGAVGVRPR